MAISENDLHDQVYDALVSYSEGDYKNEMNSPQHMKVMGDTMKEYFEANLEVTYVWTAALPPPASTPDPVTSFVSSVTFASFDLSMPMSLPGLAALIMAAFAGATIIHPTAFSVPPGTFTILPLVLPQSPSANTALMDCIIRPVCVWAKTLINPAPLSGTHAAYIGAATMSKIS
jgi:hypothetical protein